MMTHCVWTGRPIEIALTSARSGRPGCRPAILSTHSELARDVTEHSFSRAWTTTLAERQDAPNGGYRTPVPGSAVTFRDQVGACRAPRPPRSWLDLFVASAQQLCGDTRSTLSPMGAEPRRWA